MNTLRTLKKLLLGETWSLPAGIAAAIGLSLLIRELAPDTWEHLGGFFLLAAAGAALSASVARTARRRPRA